MKISMKSALLGLAAGCLLIPVSVMADTISPASYTASMDVGGSVTISKTVTVTGEAGAFAPVDVFFLADTTGSMGGEIASVQAGMGSILTSTASLGDVFYAVGEYEDWGSTYSYPSDKPYTLHQDFTGDTALVTAGIAKLTDPLGYGGDGLESQLYALEQAAETASWRDGSTRIMVWFGDYAGHDPSGPSTLATATEALVDADITVEAISVGGSLGTQADAIALATGGDHYIGIDASSIVATITAAITKVVDTYSTVGIDFGDVPAGIDATVSPVDYTGSYDRSLVRTFDFDVTFTGITEGVYDFDIFATVDGARVATEHDTLTVGGTAPVPEPATLLLMGIGLSGLIVVNRKRSAKKN